jgi:hemerythrin-like domain-containing protein
LGTWDSLHREHLEIFTRVNLLEKALIDLLQKHTDEYAEKTSDLQRDFLEAFEHGITLHFTVEEEALFPVLRKIGKNAGTLVDELLLQHRSIMKKYSTILQTVGADEAKKEILLKLVQELVAHSQKEEKSVPPIAAQMSLEQLREVDQAAKRLGYRV